MGTVKQAIIDCLSDKTADLTPEEIQQTLDAELAKPVSEMDCDLIATCTDALMEARGIPEPEAKAAVLPGESPAANQKRRFRWKPVLIAAAAALLLAATALVVSAEVFHFDLLHYTVEKIGGGIAVGKKPEGEVLGSAADLREKLAAYGLASAYLPEEYLPGATLKKLHCQDTDISTHIEILLQIGEEEVTVTIVRYDLNGMMPGTSVLDPDYREIREVAVDDTAALVLRYDAYSFAWFTSETTHTEYTVSTSLDLEETIRLVQSMREKER